MREISWIKALTSRALVAGDRSWESFTAAQGWVEMWQLVGSGRAIGCFRKQLEVVDVGKAGSDSMHAQYRGLVLDACLPAVFPLYVQNLIITSSPALPVTEHAMECSGYRRRSPEVAYRSDVIPEKQKLSTTYWLVNEYMG
jgi:hypothetical protein